MGCASSIESKNPVGRNSFISEGAPAIKKIKAFEAIKKNDRFLVEKILEEVEPTENLGLPGENYTCIHAAANYNAFQSMEVILSWLKKNKSTELEAILDIQDSKGHTPAIMCIVHDCNETLYVMLEEKVIDFNYRNQKGQSLADLAQSSPECLALLATYDKNIKQPEESKTDGQNQKSVIKFTDKRVQVERMEKRVQKAKSSARPRNQGAGNDSTFPGIPTNSKVYQLLTELSKKNTHFKDSEFLANLNSITKNQKHESWEDFSSSVWKRPNEIFGCDFSEIKLFDTIDPNDIAQGILGVCYLLCSLSALAEFPSRLTPIYVNQTANQYGVYGLNLYIRGVLTEVVIDDFFPCFGENDHEEFQFEPLFSKPKGKELWVLLAEKAWAKVYKNYVNCEAGYMDEAMETLLGTPATRHMNESEPDYKIWLDLMEADKKNYVMCACTNSTVSESIGLVSSHAYSIISVHEIGQHKILKLRNPWGNFEWNGDYSDSSKIWNDNLKKQVGYTCADDGVFCMSLTDFKKYFEYYSIGVFHEGWEYTYIESESHPKHGEYFKFSVDGPCEVYLRIHQDDERNFIVNGKAQEYSYSSADLILTKVEGDGGFRPMLSEISDVHSGAYCGERSIYPSKNLILEIPEAGEYVIRTKVRWNNGQKGQYTLSAYAPIKIELQKLSPIKNFISKMISTIAGSSECENLGNNCLFYNDNYLHYAYLHLVNKHNRKWVIEFKMTTLTNMKIDKRFARGQNTMRVEVLPGESQTVILKTMNINEATQYAWEFNHHWE